MDWQILLEDFMIASVGFYFIRYLIPNSILQKNTTAKNGIVFALCYAIFGLIRNFINIHRNSKNTYYSLK